LSELNDVLELRPHAGRQVRRNVTRSNKEKPARVRGERVQLRVCHIGVGALQVNEPLHLRGEFVSKHADEYPPVGVHHEHVWRDDFHSGEQPVERVGDML
jgi:hypothetical protein